MSSEAVIVREKNTVLNTRWRAAFAPCEVIQRVRPRETKDWLPNPHRGTTTFQRFNGDPLFPGLTWSDKDGPLVFPPFEGNLANPQYPHTTLSYCRWVWRVLEPQKGQYRWEVIERALEAARVRGQTLQVRLQPYAGGSGSPDWFWELGGGPDRALANFDPNADRKRWEPDFNHSSYIKHWGEFIAAFGKRFDGHPSLESFDVAYAGSCGECGGNANATTARKLVDIYRRSLTRTQLISMHGTHGCRYASRYPEMGWRHDCYGDMSSDGHGVVPEGLSWNSMYEDIPHGIENCNLYDTWKTAPVIFETCWTVGYWANKGWDIDYILEQGLKWHASVFMPKSSFIPDTWRDKIDAFDRKLGYRYTIRQVTLPLEAKPGDRIAYWIWLENVGVAPIYRDYTLAFRFRQGKTSVIVPVKSDLRKFLPGDLMITDKLTFPKSLKRGVVAIDFAIVDPKTHEPKVLFAVEPRLADRWHPLTHMDVL